jgi:hypothetical protein
VEGEYYAETKFEDIKEELCKHESFNDMIAIVATATGQRRESAVTAVLALLVKITALQLITKLEEVARIRQVFRYGHAAMLNQPDQEVKRLKSFYAGMHTWERMIKDFLIYRATVHARLESMDLVPRR